MQLLFDLSFNHLFIIFCYSIVILYDLLLPFYYCLILGLWGFIEFRMFVFKNKG